MIKIVFVCLGNICRSPMAHSYFTYLVNAHGLQNKIMIDSAATSRYELGNPTYPKTIQQLHLKNIPVVEHHSRQLTQQDLNADYLIGMDASNIQNIHRFVGGKSIVVKRLLEFANINKDIADPWYTDNFEKTYEDIVVGCQALLKYLIDKHQL